VYATCDDDEIDYFGSVLVSLVRTLSSSLPSQQKDITQQIDSFFLLKYLLSEDD
jgi:hypothetical protein